MYHPISRRLAATTAFMAAALLAGCGQREAPAPAPTPGPAPAAEAPDETSDRQLAAPATTLTETDDGRALTIRRGEVIEVRLAADRPQGYLWIPLGGLLPVMGTDGVPQYEPDATAPDTAPGTDVWRFVGREAGHAHLVFEYRRPGDPGAEPERTVTFHFDVE